jgi:hypothetical protein
MLVYTATKKAFSDDVLANRIEDKILNAYGSEKTVSEDDGWEHSKVTLNPTSAA